MKKGIWTVAVLFSMASCGTSSKKVFSDTVPADGSSFQKAILINQTSENAGVNAEYDWLGIHYSGWKMQKQTSLKYGKKSFDLLQIVNSFGAQKVIYFDISRFYGHF
jgi:hypothetical protein